MWSGIPQGLARGFREIGIDVEHLSAEPPAALGVPVTAALALVRMPRVRPGAPIDRLRRSRLAVSEGSRELAALRSRAVRNRLRRRGPHDALVQVGTGYSLPVDGPLATFEDTTIAQAVALSMAPWRAQTEATVAARIERQRRAYVDARACCAVSSWAACSIVRDYGIPSHKVHVVGLGRNHETRPVARDWSVPRFLFVGREWERKGGTAVLRAFQVVRQRFPRAVLELVGGHPRVELPGVRGHGPLDVADPHSREHVRALFERATCFVMPSDYEPFGIVHVEAGAAGVPSIGTTVGGAADAIGSDGGRLVAPRDHDALAAAMLELADPERAARMGRAARRHAERFTWRAVAERVARALAVA